MTAAMRGTRLRYRLSERSRVVVTIERARPGRRVGKRCLAPSRRTRRRARCTRYVRFGRFALAGKAGANSKRYSGRIGRRSMRRGRYRATLVATDAARNRSRAKRLKLRIVPPLVASDPPAWEEWARLDHFREETECSSAS